MKPSVHSAGYSRFVRLAKIALPLAALVIVGIVAARLAENPLQQVQSVEKKSDTAAGQIELVDAHYEGVDDRGQPYVLTAAAARRAMESPDTVLLDDVRADITLEGGAWLAVQAREGAYDTKAGTLSLSGDVSAFHDTGYEMHMRDIVVSMKDRAAQTRNPVRGHGPAGAVAGSGMTVAGTRVVFAGPATLTLHMRGGKG